MKDGLEEVRGNMGWVCSRREVLAEEGRRVRSR